MQNSCSVILFDNFLNQLHLQTTFADVNEPTKPETVPSARTRASGNNATSSQDDLKEILRCLEEYGVWINGYVNLL